MSEKAVLLERPTLRRSGFCGVCVHHGLSHPYCKKYDDSPMYYMWCSGFEATRRRKGNEDDE